MRPRGSRRRPTELSKEAQAIATASISASAVIEAVEVVKAVDFNTCKGCVAKKMCKASGTCMYGQTKPKEKANAKNG
jgi:hypothetical protein